MNKHQEIDVLPFMKNRKASRFDASESYSPQVEESKPKKSVEPFTRREVVAEIATCLGAFALMGVVMFLFWALA